MAMGDLTTLQAVKDYLGLTATADDALLEDMIARLSVWAQKTRMQRVIAETSYSRTFVGTGQKVFAFPDFPALSVVSVIIGAQTLTYLTDYWWTDTQLVLEPGNVFTKGAKCQVMWTAGFEETPLDIENAVIELVAFQYRQKGRIDESSKTLGGAETVSFITEPSSKRALQTLDAYRVSFRT